MSNLFNSIRVFSVLTSFDLNKLNNAGFKKPLPEPSDLEKQIVILERKNNNPVSNAEFTHLFNDKVSKALFVIDPNNALSANIFIDGKSFCVHMEQLPNHTYDLFKKIHQAFVSKLVIQKGSEEFASIEFAQTLFMFLLKNRSDLYHSLKLSDLELKDQLNIWVSVWNKKAEQHRPVMS